mgnify:FL=1
MSFMLRLLVLLGLLSGSIVGSLGCTSNDGPDPATAPRSNVPALSGADSLDISAEGEASRPVPDITVTTLSGASIPLSEQRGRVLLLNFWATWCAPCREEIPDLIDLHQEMKADGVMVIGVALDQEGESVVAPFVEQQSIPYPIVIDAGRQVESHFGPIYALPTTVVVGPDGMIRRRITGLFPVDAMRSRLEEMVATGAANAAS